MADIFENYHDGDGLIAPARSAVAVTPSDDTDLAQMSRSLYVGTGGNVEVNMADTGTAVVFVNVQDGTLLPIRVTRVLDANTTASNIVSLY